MYIDYRFNGIMYKKTSNLQFNEKGLPAGQQFPLPHGYESTPGKHVCLTGWKASSDLTVNAKGSGIYTVWSPRGEDLCAAGSLNNNEMKYN